MTQAANLAKPRSLGTRRDTVQFDQGRHYRAKIGYLLLATEQTITDDVYTLAPSGVGLHFTRVAIADSITVETLQSQADLLAEAASISGVMTMGAASLGTSMKVGRPNSTPKYPQKPP